MFRASQAIPIFWASPAKVGNLRGTFRIKGKYISATDQYTKSGQDHCPTWTCKILGEHDGEEVGCKATGETKKEARDSAILAAYKLDELCVSQPKRND